MNEGVGVTMEAIVEQLRERIALKETLEVGDVAIIAAEDPQMLAFAVVTDISRDLSRKAEWWHVSMQMLSVPLQTMTWTLRMEQMCGVEIFTMGGKKMFMAPVYIPFEPHVTSPDPLKTTKKKQSADNRKTMLRIIK
jgi:hypothetical protein